MVNQGVPARVGGWDITQQIQIERLGEGGHGDPQNMWPGRRETAAGVLLQH